MDYLYENLGDERFQELCNCLVAKEFPDFQSFPVGQRDGGRDSLVYFMESIKKDFIVFQVKYVRNPHKIDDVHKWFTKIIKEITNNCLPDADIMLFGSRAMNTAGDESDYDVLIITSQVLAPNEKTPIRTQIRKDLLKIGIRSDIQIQSKVEIEKKKNLPGHLIRNIIDLKS